MRSFRACLVLLRRSASFLSSLSLDTAFLRDKSGQLLSTWPFPCGLVLFGPKSRRLGDSFAGQSERIAVPGNSPEKVEGSKSEGAGVEMTGKAGGETPTALSSSHAVGLIGKNDMLPAGRSSTSLKH